MTPEESACCRAMHGKCGDMTKMGCCKTEIGTDGHPQLASSAPSADVQPMMVAEFSPAPAFFQQATFVLMKAPSEHPPPGLLIVRIANLRI